MSGAYVPHTADGLAILLWSTAPEAAQHVATPFFHAAAAAAMDVPVEIHFAARSVMLLKRGVAETLPTHPDGSHALIEAMREAHAHGASLLACPTALAAHGLQAADLIPECSAGGGVLAFTLRAIDLRWRSLVY